MTEIQDSRKKTVARYAICLGILALIVGCGKETTGDTTLRNLDLDNKKNQVLTQNLASATGTYVGEIDGSDVSLELYTGRVAPDSSTNSPPPTLLGTLVVAPRIYMANVSQLRIPYSINSGTRDAGANQLSLFVADGSKILCDIVSDSELNCSWQLYLLPRFTLRRAGADQIDQSPNGRSQVVFNRGQSYRGIYSGRTTNGPYTVKAQFSYAKTNANGSTGLPRLSIIGRFTFTADGTSVTTPFTDGSYDISTNTLVISIPGDISPISISCTIEDHAALNCAWDGPKSFTIVLKPSRR